MNRAFALAALLVVSGCATDYQLLLKPGVEEQPRVPCQFAVTSDPVSDKVYEPIGRFEMEFYPSHSLASFEDSVKTTVCSIGADVVVATFDDGRIKQAWVYRKRASPLD